MTDKTEYIDIHIHILPGLDDGAKTMDQALSMFRTAAEQGMTAMVVTPHYKPESFIVEESLYRETFEAFRQRAGEIRPDIPIYPGNEIYFHQGMTEALEKGLCHTLAGTDYVLVEFSPAEHFSYLCRAVDLLTCEGYRPVLAHVENYRTLQKEEGRVRELIDRGALIQVDAGNVDRARGGKFVKRLFRAREVHFVSTDAHDPVRRPAEMAACLKTLRRWCGRGDYMEQVLRRNQERLLRNEYIE